MSANALTAYQRGATGAGVRVGIIDSGIDLNSAEFENRIDPASAAFAGNTSLQDEGGHGTAVAFTLGGRRNGVGTLGFAFDATLIILRTDTPGTCASADGCSHSDRNIAAGLDAARVAGARVVNISLGGSAASSSLVQAIDRATAAGIIIVISAGNDGAAEPDPLAAIALNNAVARGLVIIAGSVGSNNQLSSFSNRAGAGANFYLAAVGEDVRAPNNAGVPFLWTGTSFSAPQISGAVALLAQAFPTLTGAQIVDILYRSARDGGAVGVDPFYGRGILDLAGAFQPIGGTSVAGTSARVSLLGNGVLSAPMGDARQAGLNAVILDEYKRAFGINLARTVAAAPPERRLTNALVGEQRSISVAAGSTIVAVSIAPGRPATALDRLQLSEGDAQRARLLAATVTGRLGVRADFAIGVSQGAGTVSARLAGRSDPAFLVARGPAASLGFASSPVASLALRRQLGAFGLTLAAESGDVIGTQNDVPLLLRDRSQRWGYDRVAIGLDRRIGPVQATLTASHLGERNSLLGAHFGDGLGAAQASSWFIDAEARIDAGGGWSVGGAYRRGWTIARIRSGLAGSGLIGTSAFAADIGKAGLFGKTDRLSLRLAQPLRVVRGGVDLTLPTYFDYASGTVSSVATQRLNLVPTGHELDAELLYEVPLWSGYLQSNLFWRRDPGNFAALPDDYGMAMRYSYRF